MAAGEQLLSDSKAAKACAEAQGAKKLQKAKKQQNQHPQQAEEPQQVQLLGLHHHSQQVAGSPTQQAQHDQDGRGAKQPQRVTQENRAEKDTRRKENKGRKRSRSLSWCMYSMLGKSRRVGRHSSCQ